jgi:hypothetical protein
MYTGNILLSHSRKFNSLMRNDVQKRGEREELYYGHTKDGVLFVCLLLYIHSWHEYVDFIGPIHLLSFHVFLNCSRFHLRALGDLPMEVKPSDHETDYSPTSSSVVRNTRSSTSVYPYDSLLLNLVSNECVNVSNPWGSERHKACWFGYWLVP